MMIDPQSATSEQLDPGHGARRSNLHSLGVVGTTLGAIVLVSGLVTFGSALVSSMSPTAFFRDPLHVMESTMKTAVAGIAFTGLGSIVLMVGLRALFAGNAARMLRYTSAEVTPVLRDTVQVFRNMVPPPSPPQRASSSSSPPTREVVRVRCRACSALQEESARFCNACGTTLQ